MSTWVWIVIAIAVVVVIVLIALAAIRRRNETRRREHLQDRFGPEYDRTIDLRDNRRDAERELSDRERRRDELNIVPLSEGARARYSEQWQQVQALFVDQPDAAASRADDLVRQVMRERGYPVDDFDAQAELVSVDYPHIADDYRTAHDIAERSRNRQASTEDLRTAMLRYRSLFDALLETEARST